MRNITIIAEDRVGLLADVSYVLGKAKINIESISVDVIAGKAVISLTVKDANKAKEILETSGYTVAETNSIIIKLTDKPGELSKITSMLAEQHVNIENVHVLSRDGKNTMLTLAVDKPKKAQDMLKDYLVEKEEEQ